MSIRLILTIICAGLLNGAYAQQYSLLNAFKPGYTGKAELADLDGDGDPDLVKARLFNNCNAIWVDDDDDMMQGDHEGDLDNDCLLIDRNRDGIFAGPGDLSIDWIDTDHDGEADIQLVVENSDQKSVTYWDWSSNYMWIIDDEKDQSFNFINWKELVLRCWTHAGASKFFEDYHGQTLFLKTHAPSYRIKDLRINWENPFLFYDTDQDGLTEMSVRLEDKGHFTPGGGRDISLNGVVNRAFVSADLDNDNAPSNEFDFDFSLYFEGKGFSYKDQVHRINNRHTAGIDEQISHLLYDKRWRHVKELVYTSRDAALHKIFNEGEWSRCWMVFDEDDDCERWERVEFYEPKSFFRIGKNKNGIDHNPQADAAGDRGEWDEDNSGKGCLYTGFDGKIHLYGAEKGCWRIDQNAACYQGWGGLYEGEYKRIPVEPEQFPTITYEDTDGDGFFDLIKHDLDGDTTFERITDLKALGINSSYEIISTGQFTYKEYHDLFEKAAGQMWDNALQSIQVARALKINYKWYASLMTARNTWEKYSNGYWLQFYIFNDLLSRFEKNNQQELISLLMKAYYGRDWLQLYEYVLNN
jgi:hypothetical protein